MSEGRRYDPRRLSRRKPGRSEIQDDPPPLPPSEPTPLTPNKDQRETVGVYRRNAGVKHPEPDEKTLKKRELRGKGALPKGSRDVPPGGNVPAAPAARPRRR
jgi:hypothetical protein